MECLFKKILFIAIFILCTAMPHYARADCVNPAAKEGGQVYNSTYKTMQFCDGTTWWNMKGGGGGASVANPADCVDGVIPKWSNTEMALVCPTAVIASGGFDFPDTTHVQGSATLVTSDIVEIDLAEDPPVDLASVLISGDGNPEYRICADSTCSSDPAFTNANGTVGDNQFLQVRLTATDIDGTGNTVTVTVAGTSVDWTVTTVNAIQLTIAANTVDYDLLTAAQNAGWVNGQAVEVTIDPGIIVGATSTANVAFDTGAFPAGTQVTIINNGRISGAGGNGGGGGGTGGNSVALKAGKDGGAAINAQVTVFIDNTNGEIWGGGGGGSGAGYTTLQCFADVPAGHIYAGGPGGGGAGSTPGNGGATNGSTTGAVTSPASSGTATAGGTRSPGAPCAYQQAQLEGGHGGGPGEDGGVCESPYQSCGAPGLAGASIVTNGNSVTWLAIGDRRGPIQ